MSAYSFLVICLRNDTACLGGEPSSAHWINADFENKFQ
jgi:hypothetical protein